MPTAEVLDNLPTRRQRFLHILKGIGGWVPVVFVAGIIIYGYYVYVVEYCSKFIFMIFSCVVLTLLNYEPPYTVRVVLYLIVFNFFALMLAINYIITIYKSPGSPLDFNLKKASEGNDSQVGFNEAKDPKNTTFVLPSTVDRYCGICDTHKPERCHHCSVCGRCILKMDHHCPWFNNCVGYGNYKFFISVLFYAILFCFFIFGTLLQELIWELSNDKTTSTSIQFLIICVLAFVMGMSCVTLFSYHCYLVMNNMTTLEQIDRSDARRHPDHPTTGPHPYDLGKFRNFRQVFGNNPLIWFLPIKHDPANKGLLFPKRDATGI